MTYLSRGITSLLLGHLLLGLLIPLCTTFLSSCHLDGYRTGKKEGAGDLERVKKKGMRIEKFNKKRRFLSSLKRF